MNCLQLNLDHNSPTQEAGRFRTTRWSVVLLSAQSQAPGSKAALAELCRLYWFPLYAFVRRRGYGPVDTQDLVQGLFLYLLDHKALAEVDSRNGKFRSFLLASIKNYLSKEADRARCLKRGGNVEFVPWARENAEEVCQFEPADFLTAETIFDARWATALLHETMARLGNQYATQGKSATLQALDAEIHSLCEALVASEGRLGP